jgi:hypothetical protein
LNPLPLLLPVARRGKTRRPRALNDLGWHASSMGMAALPGNAPVEVEMISSR